MLRAEISRNAAYILIKDYITESYVDNIGKEQEDKEIIEGTTEELICDIETSKESFHIGYNLEIGYNIAYYLKERS